MGCCIYQLSTMKTSLLLWLYCYTAPEVMPGMAYGYCNPLQMRPIIFCWRLHPAAVVGTSSTTIVLAPILFSSTRRWSKHSTAILLTPNNWPLVAFPMVHLMPFRLV